MLGCTAQVNNKPEAHTDSRRMQSRNGLVGAGIDLVERREIPCRTGQDAPPLDPLEFQSQSESREHGLKSARESKLVYQLRPLERITGADMIDLCMTHNMAAEFVDRVAELQPGRNANGFHTEAGTKIYGNWFSDPNSTLNCQGILDSSKKWLDKLKWAIDKARTACKSSAIIDTSLPMPGKWS